MFYGYILNKILLFFVNFTITKNIIDIKSNYFNYRYLKYNAYKTVQEFTWKKRALKILKHYTDLKKKD